MYWLHNLATALLGPGRPPVYAVATCLLLGISSGMLVSPSDAYLVTGGADVPLSAVLPNNLAFGVLLVLGGLTGGVLTCASLVFSGVVWGGYLSSALRTFGLWHTVAMVVPHGVLEVPGIVVLGVTGLRIARLLLAYAAMGSGEERGDAVNMQAKGLSLSACGGFTLIVGGAFVESHITPVLAGIVA